MECRALRRKYFYSSVLQVFLLCYMPFSQWFGTVDWLASKFTTLYTVLMVVCP